VSRRKERARRGEAGAARGEAGAARDEAGAARGDAGTAARWSLPAQIALLIAVFGVTTLVAELAGAANLGVALGIGQIAFAIATVYLLVRG
jgi:hypothetical protein